jgi:hypothetical protein
MQLLLLATMLVATGAQCSPLGDNVYRLSRPLVPAE